MKLWGIYVKLVIFILIKFLEFIWLWDKFCILDLISEDFDEFVKVFVKGGWVGVLKIEDCLRLVIGVNLELVNEFVRWKGKLNLYVNWNGLKRVVGLNFYLNDINDYLRKFFVENLNDVVLGSISFFEKKLRFMGFSMIF